VALTIVRARVFNKWLKVNHIFQFDRFFRREGNMNALELRALHIFGGGFNIEFLKFQFLVCAKDTGRIIDER